MSYARCYHGLARGFCRYPRRLTGTRCLPLNNRIALLHTKVNFMRIVKKRLVHELAYEDAFPPFDVDMARGQPLVWVRRVAVLNADLEAK